MRSHALLLIQLTLGGLFAPPRSVCPGLALRLLAHRLCLLGAERTNRVRGRHRRHGGVHRAFAPRALPLRCSLLALLYAGSLGGGPVATLLGSQLVLAPHQRRQRVVPPLAQLIQAGCDGEALLALGLVAHEALFNGRTLSRHLRARCGLGGSTCSGKQQDQRGRQVRARS